MEDDLQRACVTWFRLQYPEYAPLLFAIPNGGQRSKFEAARLKAQGVTAGVPDLLLARPKPGSHPGTVAAAGLFLELKVGANKPSDAQKEMLKRLEAAGYNTKLVYSFDAFREAVKQHIGY